MAVGPLLSLEDHFVSKTCQQDDVAKLLSLHQFPPPVRQQIIEVGPQRIKVMDEGGVRLQVVSHVPVVIRADDCRKTNDELAAAVKENEPRFAAFAVLPMSDISAIPTELERCVKELGFVGALIPNHANGVYYDGDEYLPMWQAAERLDVPVYLHPCPPSPQAAPLFKGNYSSDVSFCLSTYGWDWHANCGLHFARLYSAGLFDKCPKLKIIIGHLGEMIPFMLGRLQRQLALTQDAKSWKTSISDAYKKNIWVTTSGMFDIEPFKLTLAVTDVDRIMFSVDYPFESTVVSRNFMEEVQKSVLVSEEEFAGICYKNAEKLLGVKVAS